MGRFGEQRSEGLSRTADGGCCGMQPPAAGMGSPGTCRVAQGQGAHGARAFPPLPALRWGSLLHGVGWRERRAELPQARNTAKTVKGMKIPQEAEHHTGKPPQSVHSVAQPSACSVRTMELLHVDRKPWRVLQGKRSPLPGHQRALSIEGRCGGLSPKQVRSRRG